MEISSYSIFMGLLWFTLATWIGCGMLRKAEKYGLAFISVIFLLAILRAFLPLDYTGSLVIRSEKIYPMIEGLLATRIFKNITIGGSLLLLWGGGAVFQLLRFFSKCVQQSKFLRNLPCETPDSKLSRLLCDVCNELGYKGKVDLTVSPKISTAYQAGFRHLHILLSINVSMFSEQDIRSVFRHEVCHYMGGDLWIKVGMKIAGSLLWWNPVIYMLNHSVEQLQELLCDKRACRKLSKKGQLEYLETLLHFAKGTTAKPSEMTVCYLGNVQDARIKQRFQLLLLDEPRSQRHSRFCFGIGCMVCLLLFIASYLIILQPVGFPPEMEDGYSLMILTPQNAYILHTNDGEYAVYCNGDFNGIIASEESLLSQPYCDLPIIQEGDTKP